jgi:hypothetical protein
VTRCHASRLNNTCRCFVTCSLIAAGRRRTLIGSVHVTTPSRDISNAQTIRNPSRRRHLSIAVVRPTIAIKSCLHGPDGGERARVAVKRLTPATTARRVLTSVLVSRLDATDRRNYSCRLPTLRGGLSPQQQQQAPFTPLVHRRRSSSHWATKNRTGRTVMRHFTHR